MGSVPEVTFMGKSILFTGLIPMAGAVIGAAVALSEVSRQ